MDGFGGVRVGVGLREDAGYVTGVCAEIEDGREVPLNVLLYHFSFHTLLDHSMA